MNALAEQMPASLLAEWREYEELEPFGSNRDNFHAAMIAALIANVNRDPKRTPTAWRISDFIYKDSETERDRSDSVMIGNLRAVAVTKAQAEKRSKR